MKRRRNEYCPLHKSLVCCGREQARKERRFRLGVQRIEDPHHPRGYREMRPPAEMRKLLNRKIAEPGREVRNLSRDVYGLQRDSARPHRAERHGRGPARRSSRKHSSSPLAVQSPKGIEEVYSRTNRLINVP